MIDQGAHGADALALDKDFSGMKEGSCVDLEQTRGVEHDGRGSRLLRCGICGEAHQQNGERRCEAREGTAIN